jgi:hypothetical protein
VLQQPEPSVLLGSLRENVRLNRSQRHRPIGRFRWFIGVYLGSFVPFLVLRGVLYAGKERGFLAMRGAGERPGERPIGASVTREPARGLRRGS